AHSSLKQPLVFLYLTFALPAVDVFAQHRATPQISPLSLHDALPISPGAHEGESVPPHAAAALEPGGERHRPPIRGARRLAREQRPEEHTSELQSRSDLVCRRLL